MSYRSFLIFVSVFLGFYSLLHSQVDRVGINTTTPRTTLEVAGDMNINGAIQVDMLNSVQSGDENALLGQVGTGFIKELDVAEEGVAIAYFQEYRLKNMNGDWVLNFNTNIDASKYVVTITSAFFNQELVMSSNASNFTIPYASAFIQGGTWRIIADYPSANPTVVSDLRLWVIRTLIISKTFSKELPQQNVTLTGTNEERRTGAAASPVIN